MGSRDAIPLFQRSNVGYNASSKGRWFSRIALVVQDFHKGGDSSRGVLRVLLQGSFNSIKVCTIHLVHLEPRQRPDAECYLFTTAGGDSSNVVLLLTLAPFFQ